MFARRPSIQNNELRGLGVVDAIKHEMRSTLAGLPCRGEWSRKRVMISFDLLICRLLLCGLAVLAATAVVKWRRLGRMRM